MVSNDPNEGIIIKFDILGRDIHHLLRILSNENNYDIPKPRFGYHK